MHSNLLLAWFGTVSHGTVSVCRSFHIITANNECSMRRLRTFPKESVHLLLNQSRERFAFPTIYSKCSKVWKCSYRNCINLSQWLRKTIDDWFQNTVEMRSVILFLSRTKVYSVNMKRVYNWSSLLGRPWTSVKLIVDKSKYEHKHTCLCELCVKDQIFKGQNMNQPYWYP